MKQPGQSEGIKQEFFWQKAKLGTIYYLKTYTFTIELNFLN